MQIVLNPNHETGFVLHSIFLNLARENNWGRILGVNIDDRLKEIKERHKELGPTIDSQWAAQPRPAPMSDEISEAQKLKIELAELQHSYLKHPAKR
jgi:hypothetical protein